MKENRICLLVLMLFIVHGSDASLYGKIRKLVDLEAKTSPSPSPVSSLNPDGSKADNQKNPQKEGSDGVLTDERCKLPLRTCHDQGSLTACIRLAGEAPGELSLLVQNDGEGLLKVNGTIMHESPFKEIQLSKHQAIKYNITAYLGKNILIVLDAGNGKCTIGMEAPKQDSFFKNLQSYAAQVTPMHGAYLLSLTVLITGGMWAWCKWGRRGRLVEGIPYQELEMGQRDSFAANDVETVEGWDDSWDNDWDDEDAVRTSSKNHEGNGLVNGLNSRALKRDGRGKDWDD